MISYTLREDVEIEDGLEVFYSVACAHITPTIYVEIFLNGETEEELQIKLEEAFVAAERTENSALSMDNLIG